MKEKRNTLLSRFQGDTALLVSVLSLSIISFILILTAGSFTVKDMVSFGMAYFAMFLCYKIDYTFFTYKFLSWIALALAGVLLIATAVVSDGRSIQILGFSLQTFFLIGLCLVYYFSSYLGIRINKEIELQPKDTFYLFGILAGFCGIMFTQNQSTAIILGIVLLFILVLVEAPRLKFALKVSGIFVGILLVIAFFATQISSNFDVKDQGRIATLVSRTYNFFSGEYTDQGIRAEAAVSLAPLLPFNLGNGVVKNILQERDNDYVFAVLCEELGVLVAFFVILMYLVILYRTTTISKNADGAFAKLLSYGIGIWLCLMAFIHIAVNINAIPATGQTLPFISRGGTSLILSGIMIGILLNISKKNVKQ